MADRHHRIGALAEDLEKAMRDLGAWTEPAPPLRPFTMPFAMDSMPFEHWLQLVLVPRMREIAATAEPLPMRSNLAPHAVREWDGRDDVGPIVDVLRALDELCPPARGETRGDGRRLAAGVALILGLAAWAVVAIEIATHVASAVSSAYPALVIQTFSGAIAPGPDLRPLRVTVTAAAENETLRPKMTELIVLRSMATMRNGPTAPMRFTSTAPPTVADVVAWLSGYGAEPTAAERAAGEALAIIDAAVKARTRPELHAVAPTAEELLEVLPATPGWVAPALTVVVFLLGAVPITWSLVRWAGRA